MEPILATISLETGRFISKSSLNNHTITRDSIQGCLPAAIAAINAGNIIYFNPDPSFPGYKIPLNWFDQQNGIAWFSTEMVSIGEGKSYTLLYAITTTGELRTYIKDPATGNLILQQ